MSTEAKPSNSRWGFFAVVRTLMAVGMLVIAPVMLLPPSWFGMGSIEPAQLMVKLSGDTPPHVLDVRTSPEFKRGHIMDAVLLPLHQLPFNLPLLESAQSREVVLICMSGHRSRLAGLILRMAGFDRVVNLTGGMAAWRAAGLPVDKIPA